MKTTYRVEGLTCGHCTSAVTTAIKALAPAASVQVDLANKTITIEGFEQEAAIGKAIEDAGYTFIGKV